jgi:electron transfer flavoprotein beta subunit
VKIIVCVKQVVTLPGPAVMLKDGSDVDPFFTMRRLNEPDEYAVEEALRICEGAGGGEAIALTVGQDAAVEALRKCLAMGAQRAVRIWGPDVQPHDPLSVARALAHVARDEAADLVLCGVQSTDASQQATGPALASAMGQPCVTLATRIEVIAHERRAVIHREAGGGLTEVVEVDLPAVVTVQTGINTPRAPSFKSVMLAKKAQVPAVSPGPVVASQLEVLGVSVSPPVRGQLQMIAGGATEVAARIAKLVRED